GGFAATIPSCGGWWGSGDGHHPGAVATAAPDARDRPIPAGEVAAPARGTLGLYWPALAPGGGGRDGDLADRRIACRLLPTFSKFRVGTIVSKRKKGDIMASLAVLELVGLAPLGRLLALLARLARR